MLAPVLGEISAAVPYQDVIADINACRLRAVPMGMLLSLSVTISVNRLLLYPNRRLTHRVPNAAEVSESSNSGIRTGCRPSNAKKDVRPVLLSTVVFSAKVIMGNVRCQSRSECAYILLIEGHRLVHLTDKRLAIVAFEHKGNGIMVYTLATSALTTLSVVSADLKCRESGGHYAPIADAAFGTGATLAALCAQVEHGNKIEQEAREALVRDYSNRIASILATVIRSQAGLKLRKLQSTRELTMYPTMYDGVQMFKELKHEAALEPARCDCSDKVNTLIRDHNPYIQLPYTGERFGRLIVKSLPAAPAGEGSAFLRELIDKKTLGNESKVIEETVRVVKMAHSSVPVSVATKGLNKKDKRAIAAAAPTLYKGKPGGTQPSGGATK
eukprot:6212341-Pleurochrysis_carterae.AAC.2